MLPTWTEILNVVRKIGEWCDEIILKRRKAWPVQIITEGNVSATIAPWRGVASSVWYGYIDVSFQILPMRIPVWIQQISLKYTGNWFEGERTTNSKVDGLSETQLMTTAITPTFTASFELPIPENPVPSELKIIATFKIVSERLPCESYLGELVLKKIF